MKKKKKSFFKSKFFLWTAMAVIGSTADQQILDQIKRHKKNRNL